MNRLTRRPLLYLFAGSLAVVTLTYAMETRILHANSSDAALSSTGFGLMTIIVGLLSRYVFTKGHQ